MKRFAICVLVSCVILCSEASGQSVVITTVAGGTGPSERGIGDGGPAALASLRRPFDVVVDASGNLFIADAADQRIRKVSASGTITTVAGTGIQGFSGDGGPATSATLRWPEGVAVDASGNLFIADQMNNRIRKVSASGIITTVAGNGADAPMGGIFAGDGGPAISASLTYPAGVAVDASGNLFIADAGNHRIRRVSASGIITTVAGNGLNTLSGDGGPAASASLLAPLGVAVDASGNLFIADSGNERIRKVSASGIITTVAGGGRQFFCGASGGPATSARLLSPNGVAVDTSGNLFIAERDGSRICKVSADGVITALAGTGMAGVSGDGKLAAALKGPRSVAVDAAGNLFIADTDNSLVRKVQASLTPVATASAGTDAGQKASVILTYKAAANIPSGLRPNMEFAAKYLRECEADDLNAAEADTIPTQRDEVKNSNTIRWIKLHAGIADLEFTSVALFPTRNGASVQGYITLKDGNKVYIFVDEMQVGGKWMLFLFTHGN